MIIFIEIETFALIPETIPVSVPSCKYNICVPEGWDTIPHDTLKGKLPQFNFKEMVITAIYPVAQTEYFRGNYALISFMPTINNLNKFSFKQLLSDIEKTNQSGQIKSDTLQVTFDSINSLVYGNKHVVNSYFSMAKDSLFIENCQTFYPTKFGYITVLSYKKEGDHIPMGEMLHQLSDLIQIEDEYQYVPFQKRGISIRHIIISLCAGLFVYSVIAYFPKLKKRSG
jgi:hypothetical protein